MNVYGIELTDEEVASCSAWIDQDEAKTFYKILNALIVGAERNAMNDPDEGSDFNIFCMERERYLGERKGLKKIAHLSNVLREED